MNGYPSFVRGQPPHLTGQAKKDSLLAGASAASSVPFFFGDHHPGGAEDQADPQTTLQILQQQLEFFQTFRQQTLENINTVQSKIRGILTTNIFETKTPLWSSDKTRETCTPSDASLLLENPESLPSKRKVHPDQQLRADEHVEANAKEPPPTILNQTLLRQGNQKFSEINAASEYDGKIEALQKSLKNSEHFQKTVHDLPNENLALKSNVEPLTLTIQSLKEKLPTCNRQLKDLAEETKSVQMLLGKSQEDDNARIQEANNFLRKYKELQNQKNTLEEERNQLQNGNQRSRQTQHGFQMRNQKVEEEKTAVTCRRERLNALLEFLHKEQFKLQETTKNPKMQILQLTREDSSLEQELDGNCSERQQIQEKETAAKSDLETPLHFMPTLEDKKLNLEGTLQECSGTAQVLQKDFEKLQSDKAYTENPLMTELRNTIADIDLLGSNLTRISGEYKRFSTAVTSIVEENQLFQKKLQEYRQEISQYESDIRNLTDEPL